jgi:tRNA (guanosine-2'-O-)-methyltransferase
VKALTGTEIKRLNRDWRRRTSGRLALVLAGLANPYNVGSILRTAAVFGVEAVHLVGATPGPEHPGVRKTGLGTEHSVTTVRHAAASGAVAGLRAEGFEIVALELATGAEAVCAYPFRADVCLVVGSEGHGLPAATLALCDSAVYVPQVGRVASLNVATATAVAAYEVRRREWTV